MPIEAQPGQPPGVQIPIETVGVRGSGRRPGERRLTVLRPQETEQPRTLLLEMQQYITTRQSLRDHGYFFLMGKEAANINLADATHNDLNSIMHVSPFPDNARAIGRKGNIGRIEAIFDAYAMGEYSPEKQREVLSSEEEIHALNKEYPYVSRVTQLTPAETETVTWLLARIGVQFDAPPEGFSESDASLLLRMRSATAEHQSQWEQEPVEDVYQIRRRLKV